MTYIFDVSKTLITVSIACAVLTMLFYKTNLYQSVRYICSIAVIFYMVQAFLPLYSAIGELITIDNTYENNTQQEENTAENDFINNVSVGICKQIKDVLCNRYALNRDDVTISVTVNNDDPENIIIKSVTVALIEDKNNISAELSRYIGDLLGCGCTVLVN